MSAKVMKGLVNFIRDIRNSASKDAERVRVEKELANIRHKFAGKKLDAYNKKKYMWKLVYMYMLGYNTTGIASVMAVKLIASRSFSEKNTGYITCAALLSDQVEFLQKITASVKRDIEGHNEYFQSLALSAVANVSTPEFSEQLAPSVEKLLLNPKTKKFPRKKAALTLTRLIRLNSDCLPDDEKVPKILALFKDKEIGVKLSVASLVLEMVSHIEPENKAYERTQEVCVAGLLLLRDRSKNRRSRHFYYLTVCPWLQVKLLKILQYFPPPTETKLAADLGTALDKIFSETTEVRKVGRRGATRAIRQNKKNSDHSILFEAINLVIHMCLNGVTTHLQIVTAKCGAFATHRTTNFAYVGMDAMRRLTRVPGALAGLKKHQADIQSKLSNNDVSIRKRALDLIYSLADEENAPQIVEAMLTHLKTAPYAIRAELVLKIAVLAERFAKDLRWYVDIILQLIHLSGENVTSDIWHRTTQIIKNNENLQPYAMSTCLEFLKVGGIHETGLKVAAYVMGEFCIDLDEKKCTPDNLVELLLSNFLTCSDETKAIILFSLAKIQQTFPEEKKLEDKIFGIFQKFTTHVNPELQQRACEFVAMRTLDTKALEEIFNVLPPFPEKESALLQRIRGQEDLSSEKKRKKKGRKKQKEGDDESDEESDESDDESGSDSADDDDDGDDADADTDTTDASSGNLFPPQSPLNAAVWGVETKEVMLYGDSKVMRVKARLKIQPQNGELVVLIALFIQVAGNAVLKGLTVQPPPDADVKVAVAPNTPADVSGQSKIMMQWKCRKPWATEPAFKINFTHNNQPTVVSLVSPVMICHFMTGTNMSRQDFLAQWGALQQQNETKYRCNFTLNLTPPQICSRLEQVFKFKVLQGIDPNPKNIVAAAELHSIGVHAQAQPMKMKCFFRIETSGQMAQLTLRSASPKLLSAGVVQAFAKCFRTTPPQSA